MKTRSPLYAVFALGLLVAGAAHAQTVRAFVSTSGIDNPTCFLAAPCRTFAAAIAAVAAGGEVVALDSGGYGGFSVNKSVSIIAPDGVYAAVAAAPGSSGVTVHVGTTDAVVLRGLHVYGQGTEAGVLFTAGRDLFIENCTISGFQIGISMPRIGTWGQLYVTDTVVRDNGHSAGSGHGLFTSTDSLDGNWVSIDGSVFVTNVFGIAVGANSHVAVSNTLIAGNWDRGVSVLEEIGLDGVVFAHQPTGVRQADATSTVRIGKSAFIDHGTAVNVVSGACLSRGDNFPGHATTSSGPITPLAGD